MKNTAYEIARGEDLVETIGHDRRERRAVRPRASGNGPLHVGVTPVADAGFLVRRNVGAPHLVGWPVPLLRTARELPVHWQRHPPDHAEYGNCRRSKGRSPGSCRARLLSAPASATWSPAKLQSLMLVEP